MTTQTQISQEQQQVLSSLVAGDIVQFKARGCKSFGQKHRIVEISVETEFDTIIYSVPVKDTRTNGIAGLTVGTRGLSQMRYFYTYNAEETDFIVRKAGA